MQWFHRRSTKCGRGRRRRTNSARISHPPPFRRVTKNVNPNDYAHSCVIGCHGNSLLHFGLNTKVSYEGLLGGGDLNYFEKSISQ